MVYTAYTHLCTQLEWGCKDTYVSQTDEVGSKTTIVRISRGPWMAEAVGWTLEQAIFYVAKHEWGHAIGARHENSREDTPPGCWPRPPWHAHTWLDATPFDKHSIMTSSGPAAAFAGWCDSPYLNGGQLSERDIEGVQYAYGYLAVVRDDGSVRLPVVRAEDATVAVTLRLGADGITVEHIEPATEDTLLPATFSWEDLKLRIPAVDIQGVRLVNVVLEWDDEFFQPTEWDVIR